MNRVRNCTLWGIASAVLVGLTLSQPAAAQCPSGWQRTQYRVASQDWSQAVQPLDLTTIPWAPAPAGMTASGPVTVGAGSMLASSGTAFFLLNSQDHTVYQMSFNSGVPYWTVSFKAPVENLSNIQVIQGLLYAWTTGGNLMAVYTDSTNPVAPVMRTSGAVSLGAPITGITFDGQNLWAAGGQNLWELTPATTSSRATLVNTYTLPGNAAGGMVFDGAHIWMLTTLPAQGPGIMGLIEIDPSSGQQVGSVAASVPATPSSANLIFDGYNVWFGTGQQLIKVNTATMATTNLHPNVPLNTVLSIDHYAVWATSGGSPVVAKMRGCDGQYIGALLLPDAPTEVAVVSGAHVITYQNTNMLSIR
jgi:hypothetical protein